MKKLILALALVPTSLFAGTFADEYATITSVQPIYVDRYVDRYETECYNVRVQDGSDALSGAIIGGVIGNQFGSGSGKDAMTVLGALLGANNAGGKGYRVEKHCEQVKYTVAEPVLSHFKIEYRYNGNIHKTETDRHYNVGDRVQVNVSLK